MAPVSRVSLRDSMIFFVGGVWLAERVINTDLTR